MRRKKAEKENSNKFISKELKNEEKVKYKLCKFDIDVKYDKIFFAFKKHKSPFI